MHERDTKMQAAGRLEVKAAKQWSAWKGAFINPASCCSAAVIFNTEEGKQPLSCASRAIHGNTTVSIGELTISKVVLSMQSSRLPRIRQEELRGSPGTLSPVDANCAPTADI